MTPSRPELVLPRRVDGAREWDRQAEAGSGRRSAALTGRGTTALTGREATTGTNVVHGMVGKVGRLTGAIGIGTPGAVRLAVRGGTEDFHAWADEAIPVGTRVLVVEYDPPRTVQVVRL